MADHLRELRRIRKVIERAQLGALPVDTAVVVLGRYVLRRLTDECSGPTEVLKVFGLPVLADEINPERVELRWSIYG